MDEQLKSNLTSGKHWIRLLYMLLFALALYVASVVMGVLIFVQFLFALITGNNNYQLRKFGDALSIYIFDTLQFLIYNSEDKPFPFADWPESKAEEALEGEESEQQASEATEKPKAKAASKRKASPRKKAAAKKPAKEAETESDAAENDDVVNKTEDKSDS